MKKEIVLYLHGGSDNRGCEAIVRTTVNMLRNQGFDSFTVFSAHPEEDREVGLEQLVCLKHSPTRSIPEIPIYLRAVAKGYNKLFHSEKMYYQLTEQPFIHYDFSNAIAFHIGGDHYCYNGAQSLVFRNQEVKNKGGTSILWGCSVEPSLLSHAVIDDMNTYDAIFARESITYQALKDQGVEHVYLYPDPAFTLDYEETDFSKSMNFNSVGINVSTYAVGKGNDDNLGMKNYVELIRWIQKNTDMGIYLIPHVFKPHSNDLETIDRLMNQLGNKDRITSVSKKYTAMQLKGIIRNCRFFVGARTHSTIAAYSSCVPTLVVGYSVKANGIAQDLFGDTKFLVTSVQDLLDSHRLTEAFSWLVSNESQNKQQLQRRMPEYIAKAQEAGSKVQQILGTRGY